MATGGKAWIVRAGREGRDEGLALSEQVAVIGWSELGRLEPPLTRDFLKAAIADSQPAATAPSVAAQAGQIYRFVHDIAEGDLVVLPLLADPGRFAVGRIRGPYAFRDDGPFEASDAKHTRPVEWLSESVPYEQLPTDLRSALGAQGTVSEIVKPDAARRIAAAIGARQDGDQPVVWWVNQGESYRAALDGGYLWVAKVTKSGQRRRDWDALLEARPGQLVLSYAAGRLNAVGTVTTEAFDAPRPATFNDDLWSDDGRRVDVRYRLLDEPVALGDIPIGWRADAGGPFNRNGGVKRGYCFRLPDSFVSRLAERFPQLAIGDNHRQPHDPRLTADALRRKAESSPYGLRLDPGIYATVVAALESGKHIILTGPPGTAKTTLAQAVAHTAQEFGLSSGHLLTTATADWTTYETIGGLKPKKSNVLEFEPGHFLEAIENRRWLVIDELNRSQFDRAFGQLFTVLSGQPVTLPYRRPGAKAPLTLLPEGAEPPQGPSDVIAIPREWRIVATMNVFDKSLLFEMSYALMRRFAFIEVSSPSDEVFDELIDRWSEGSAVAAETAKALLAVRGVKDIGPAVYRDIARFATQRLRQGPVRDGELRQQAFYSYLLPQFEGITDEQGDRLLKILGKGVGGASVSKLREALNTVLGLELAAPASSGGEIEEELEALDESPSGG